MTEDLRPAGLRPSDALPMQLQPEAPRPSQRRPREEPHLFDYARVVVKRRHVAIAVFVAIFLSAAVYSSRHAALRGAAADRGGQRTS
jgi:hypothetical protein